MTPSLPNLGTERTATGSRKSHDLTKRGERRGRPCPVGRCDRIAKDRRTASSCCSHATRAVTCNSRVPRIGYHTMPRIALLLLPLPISLRSLTHSLSLTRSLIHSPPLLSSLLFSSLLFSHAVPWLTPPPPVALPFPCYPCYSSPPPSSSSPPPCSLFLSSSSSSSSSPSPPPSPAAAAQLFFPASPPFSLLSSLSSSRSPSSRWHRAARVPSHVRPAHHRRESADEERGPEPRGRLDPFGCRRSSSSSSGVTPGPPWCDESPGSGVGWSGAVGCSTLVVGPTGDVHMIVGGRCDWPREPVKPGSSSSCSLPIGSASLWLRVLSMFNFCCMHAQLPP